MLPYLLDEMTGYLLMGALIGILVGVKSYFSSRDSGPPLTYPDVPDRYAHDFTVGEKEVVAKYQYVVTRMQDTFIYRRYFPETMVLTLYEEYSDEDLTIRHGRYALYHEDGSPEKIGTYLKGDKHGLWEEYDTEGNLAVSIAYHFGIKHGPRTCFYTGGQVSSVRHYRNGRIEGATNYYDEMGGLTREERYEAGQPVREDPEHHPEPATDPASPAELPVFRVKEELPLFPGCSKRLSYQKRKICADKRLTSFIYRNIRYPARARELGITGEAMVSFRITAAGKVDRIRVVRGLNRDISEELVRLVRMMPDWIPGRQNGKPVNVQFNLPVNFQDSSS